MTINNIKQLLLNLPRAAKQSFAIFLDLYICIFSVWLAFGLRLDEWRLLQDNEWWVLIASAAFSLPIFVVSGLYRAIFRYIGSAAFISMARACIIYTSVFFCVFTLIGVSGVPRSIGIIQPILLFIGILLSRYAIRSWFRDINLNEHKTRKVQTKALIYGAGIAGRQLALALSVNNQIQVRGFIDDDKYLQGNTVNGIKVFSNDNIKDLATRLEVTDVILAIPSINQARRNEILASLGGCGVRVRTLPGLLEMASGRIKLSDLHDININDLLGREIVPPNFLLLKQNIQNKNILVTGAAGSIGSELCRQIIKFAPKSLILIDSSEYALYIINQELEKLTRHQENSYKCKEVEDDIKINSSNPSDITIIPYLASVRDKDLIYKIFTAHKPDTVFHAAAYKHVPLVEQNPVEGIRNNVLGTLVCAEASLESGVSSFILISTDKAVRPTNIMGASKRVAELVLQALADNVAIKNNKTIFSIVRFGNVLGSSGSVIPLFNQQIKEGGPITLTHFEVTRYFMTIPEAAQLVIQSSSMALGGDVFVLDMGQPVKIYDLAIKMVYLSGLIIKDQFSPHGDIEIKVTGLRAGEKLYEELLIGDNPQRTNHPKIMKANEEFFSWDNLKIFLDDLDQALNANDINKIRSSIKKLVSGYHPNDD